jgi:hypothetical protein
VGFGGGGGRSWRGGGRDMIFKMTWHKITFIYRFPHLSNEYVLKVPKFLERKVDKTNFNGTFRPWDGMQKSGV